MNPVVFGLFLDTAAIGKDFTSSRSNGGEASPSELAFTIYCGEYVLPGIIPFCADASRLYNFIFDLFNPTTNRLWNLR